jgi:hypothetical protein
MRQQQRPRRRHQQKRQRRHPQRRQRTLQRRRQRRQRQRRHQQKRQRSHQQSRRHRGRQRRQQRRHVAVGKLTYHATWRLQVKSKCWKSLLRVRVLVRVHATMRQRSRDAVGSDSETNSVSMPRALMSMMSTTYLAILRMSVASQSILHSACKRRRLQQRQRQRLSHQRLQCQPQKRQRLASQRQRPRPLPRIHLRRSISPTWRHQSSMWVKE